MAMPALIESTVRVTIRHSESAPTASEPATAWVSLDDAKDATRPSKPVPPGDRIMAEILECAGESPATLSDFAAIAGNIAAARPGKWQNGGGRGDRLFRGL